MNRSLKGLLVIGLLIGQLISISANHLCPAPYVDGCGEWSFDNQAEWSSLCNRYYTCGSGLQSPIDIPSTLTCNGECVRPQIVYGNSVGVNLFNIKETLAVVPDPGSYVVVDEVQYDLQWIEFRQPSEHSMGGNFADFEAQFWHQSVDGQWLAIAVLYDVDENEHNAFFASFWDMIPGYYDCSCGNGRIDSGEECDDGMMNSNTQPDKCRMNCQLPMCGDGVKDRTEQCDMGEANNDTLASTSTTDAQKVCRTDCRYSFCGDGVMDAGEECDDGGVLNGDGCSSFCTSECGNGVVDGGEECDEGTTVNNQRLPNGCRPGCVNNFCGDGVRDRGEECDNGASNSDVNRNACRTNCVLAFCGDGVTDTGEQCDPLNNALCTQNCQTITPTCGNGQINVGEECDAGTSNSNTASARCRADCTLPFCGDGVRDSGTLSSGVEEPVVFSEECDVIGGSTTCNPQTCQNECGDGILSANEQCDLGGGVGTEPNHGSRPNQCRKSCILPTCGDGIVDSDEECDMGAGNGSPTVSCDAFCRYTFCGDGIEDSMVTDRTKEICDDGNNNDGDGCSSVCQIECGDGYMTGIEECDMGDENANAPDTCKLDCKVPVCGDGYVDFNEECDYNAVGQSTMTCRENCKLPFCGDGIVDSAMGEDCDQGYEANSDIIVGGCSTRCVNNDCANTNPGTVGDLNRAMACDGCFYSYYGSSTRPPCWNGVHWLVAQRIQKISQYQIDLFQYHFGDSAKRTQQGTCMLEDKYSTRECMCVASMGVRTMTREACSDVPRKPALQTTLDVLRSNDSQTPVLEEAISDLISLLVREPLILPTYYASGTTASHVIACETEAFYRRAHMDLMEAVEILSEVGNFNMEVQPMALKHLIWLEHVLQFLESLQVLTAGRSPTGTLTNALAVMIGSGAAAPFLPSGSSMSPMKETLSASVGVNAPVLVQRSTSGLEARLFRGAVGFNIDPEIHRFSNIPDESVWHVRFVHVEFMKQYGYRNNDGNILFNLSDEKVILESNLLNLFTYN